MITKVILLLTWITAQYYYSRGLYKLMENLMSDASQKTHAIQIRVSANMLDRIDTMLSNSDFKNRADLCRSAIRNYLNQLETDGIGGGSVLDDDPKNETVQILQQILAYQSLHSHMVLQSLNEILQALRHDSIENNDLIKTALDFVQSEHKNILKRIDDVLGTIQ